MLAQLRADIADDTQVMAARHLTLVRSSLWDQAEPVVGRLGEANPEKAMAYLMVTQSEDAPWLRSRNICATPRVMRSTSPASSARSRSRASRSGPTRSRRCGARPAGMPVDPARFRPRLRSTSPTPGRRIPQRLLELNARWAQDYFGLWNMFFRRVAGEEVDPVASPAANDRRFQSDSWSDKLAFDFLKQSYLAVGRQLQDLVAATPDMNETSRAKVDFFVRQYVNAISPANFASTNPDVIAKTLATGGLNLLTGFSNLLDDLARGDGLVKHRAPADFELGKNIAATPGSVVLPERS